MILFSLKGIYFILHQRKEGKEKKFNYQGDGLKGIFFLLSQYWQVQSLKSLAFNKQRKLENFKKHLNIYIYKRILIACE